MWPAEEGERVYKNIYSLTGSLEQYEVAAAAAVAVTMENKRPIRDVGVSFNFKTATTSPELW